MVAIKNKNIVYILLISTCYISGAYAKAELWIENAAKSTIAITVGGKEYSIGHGNRYSLGPITNASLNCSVRMLGGLAGLYKKILLSSYIGDIKRKNGLDCDIYQNDNDCFSDHVISIISFKKHIGGGQEKVEVYPEKMQRDAASTAFNRTKTGMGSSGGVPNGAGFNSVSTDANVLEGLKQQVANGTTQTFRAYLEKNINVLTQYIDQKGMQAIISSVVKQDVAQKNTAIAYINYVMSNNGL
jgi:hypothetical protein